MMSMNKVVVIGQGYVGLNIAVHAASSNEVIGFDLNSTTVTNLNKGKSHIEDISNVELNEMLAKGTYKATSNHEDIRDADIYVIAVPTPLDENRKPDLSYVENAADIIAKAGSKPALIINESTSFPGTLRGVIKKRIEEKSGISHHYAASPERVDPGRSDFNQKNTPRLIGGINSDSIEKAHLFYSTFCEDIRIVQSPEVAEAAKLFENTFRQVNIALVNEFAQITHALGIPVRDVLEAANTKPYGFMKFDPSAGVGGHCIPVDPSYLSFIAEKNGVSAKFIDLANKVNLEMGEYLVSRVQEDNGLLKGKSVQIVGVAYKPNISDTRETPALKVYEALEKAGAMVNWHDPIVETWNGSRSAELGGDIGIVVTKHNAIDSNQIKAKFKYIFDSTGKVEGAVQL